jgi:hypothetical protein
MRTSAYSGRATPARLGKRPCHPARSRRVVSRLRHVRRSAPRALRRPWSRGHRTGAGNPCLAEAASGAASCLGLHRTWRSLPPDRPSLLLARNARHLARPLGDGDKRRQQRPSDAVAFVGSRPKARSVSGSAHGLALQASASGTTSTVRRVWRRTRSSCIPSSDSTASRLRARAAAKADRRAPPQTEAQAMQAKLVLEKEPLPRVVRLARRDGEPGH